MNTNPEIQDLEIVPSKKRRKGDGGTYLVVADDSDEFRLALKYACQAAINHRAHVGILRILDDSEFQHWGAIEEKLKREQRIQAESYIWTVAGLANECGGVVPSLYFEEGDSHDALIKTIDADENIIKLVLGGRGGGTPGPLVSYCVGKGLEKLRVPVVVVPGHLKDFA